MPEISHQTLRRLTYFATIAEVGSIRGAAERLGLSVPVVSEALADLEAELGVTLATRSTRAFDLTDAGRKLHVTASEILRLAQSAKDALREDAPLAGTLAITLPVELATHWIAPHLAGFQAHHPEIRFRIDASDEVTTLKNSPFDLAIRTAYLRPGSDPARAATLPLACVARTLPRMARTGTQITLPDTTLIGPRPERGLLARDPRTGQDIRLQAASGLTVGNRGVAIALARQGLGATLVVATSVTEAVAAGELCPLLPDHDFGSITLDTVFRDTLPSPTAKAFASYLAANTPS